MRVHIASPLFSYTSGRNQVDARGSTLGAVLEDLETRFPGIRFRVIDEQGRVRPHILLYVGGRATRDLDATIAPDDEVHIVAALSGG